jgi:hypothetical protein
LKKYTRPTIAIILLLAFLSSYSQGIPDSAYNQLIRTDNGGWVAGDATYSIYLPDGRTLWLFGDSFIGSVAPDSSLVSGAKMIRNCAVVQQENAMFALYNGTFSSPDDFVSTLYPDSTWHWPEHGIVENDTLKIIFSEFGETDGTPGWNFEYLNAWLVYFSYPGLEYIKQEIIPYYQNNGVMYGDRIMNHGNYTYIYGRKEVSADLNIPMPHIARVEKGNLKGQWEFYDGNNWSADPSVSKKISDQPVSQQYGVMQHQDKFVMITQEIWLGTKIYSMVANQPQGPWSYLQLIYETPLPFDDIFTYNAYPHPQFDENNELLVSYNSNGDFWQIFNNVEIYRPKFFRIPYEKIHPSFTTSNINNTHQRLTPNIYPNPVKDILYVQIDTELRTDDNFTILNSFGEPVLITQVTDLPIINGCYAIPVGDMASGLYIIQTKSYSLKFIHS